MAVDNPFSFNAPASPIPASSGHAGDRIPSQVWLNVGIYVEIDGVSTFVSIPFGIPIDTMKPHDLSKVTNPELYQKFAIANKILEQLQRGGDALDGGTTAPLSGLSLELYKKRDVQEQEAPTISIPDFFKVKPATRKAASK